MATRRTDNRGFGDEFEKEIADLCDEIGIIARSTKNSGARYDDGDLYTCTTQIEAKRQGRRVNPVINLNEFDKIVRQAARHNRVPVLMLKSKEGRTFAVVDMELFLRRYVAGEEQVEYEEEELI